MLRCQIPQFGAWGNTNCCMLQVPLLWVDQEEWLDTGWPSPNGINRRQKLTHTFFSGKPSSLGIDSGLRAAAHRWRILSLLRWMSFSDSVDTNWGSQIGQQKVWEGYHCRAVGCTNHFFRNQIFAQKMILTRTPHKLFVTINETGNCQRHSTKPFNKTINTPKKSVANLAPGPSLRGSSRGSSRGSLGAA